MSNLSINPNPAYPPGPYPTPGPVGPLPPQHTASYTPAYPPAPTHSYTAPNPAPIPHTPSYGPPPTHTSPYPPPAYGASPVGPGYGAPPPHAVPGPVHAPPHHAAPGPGYGAPPVSIPRGPLPGAHPGHHAPPQYPHTPQQGASYQAYYNYYANVPIQQAFAPIRGKKRALLIGCNYEKDAKSKLRGCVNDVKMIHELLISKFQYAPADVHCMTDKSGTGEFYPTKRKIMKQFRWLVSGARPGDSLFFLFSGHGSQVRDLDGDELDGMDEAILPLDYRTKGKIIDDIIHDELVKPLPEGVRMTAVMDCCHSGTGMDLPYEHKEPEDIERENRIKRRKERQNRRHRKKHRVRIMGDFHIMIAEAAPSSSMSPNMSKAKREQIYRKNMAKISRADVVLFSGCADDQTSSDTSALTGRHGGAMCYAFTHALETPGLTYRQLLRKMRDILKGQNSSGRKFSQIPQVSTGRPFNLDQPFGM